MPSGNTKAQPKLRCQYSIICNHYVPGRRLCLSKSKHILLVELTIKKNNFTPRVEILKKGTIKL